MSTSPQVRLEQEQFSAMARGTSKTVDENGDSQMIRPTREGTRETPVSRRRFLSKAGVLTATAGALATSGALAGCGGGSGSADAAQCGKRAIETHLAPAAVGPYSQAIDDGTFVFCSGQIGLDPVSGELVPGGTEAETPRVLENLREVLCAAGLDLNAVVKTTVFLTSLADFAAFNQIYGEFFENPFPARSTVEVPALPRGASVEIEATARRC
jgi:2-iminobutanoate/2-iminopropanoate deaminase